MAASQPASNANSPTQLRSQIIKKDDPLGADVEGALTRVKTPTRPGSQKRPTAGDRNELERINFQLAEQVKDLKFQLAGKTNELTRLQENLATRTSEHDEKMRKMREIFAQATKNLDGYRASIAAKDTELQRLRDDITQTQAREQDLRASMETKNRDAEKLNSELNSQKALYGSQIKQLEIKQKHLSAQLQETKTEYEQYKKRASQLLQKSSNGQNDSSSRLNELEAMVQRLQVEKSDLESEKLESEGKIELLEHDIRHALDRIRDLDVDNEAFCKMREDNALKQSQIARLQERMVADRDAQEQALKSIQTTHNATLQQLQQLLDAKEQNRRTTEPASTSATAPEEEDSYDQMIDRLNEENAQLHKKLAQKEKELEQCTFKLLSATVQSEQTVAQQRVDQTAGKDQQQLQKAEEEEEPNGVDVYASMSHLLSPLASASESRIDLERKAKHLSIMLEESEERVAALRAQEKVLKDEIRKLDSFDRRQNLNIEYLKNVLLKFMQSENKEFMVPVLAKLLFLDPAETEELRKSVISG